MQSTSKQFADVARQLVDKLPRCPQRTIALNQLVEAKDAAVRAAMWVPPTPMKREELIEEFERLHAIWQIGSDDAAADAVDDIMEALPELLAKVKRLEEALTVLVKGAQLSEYETLTDDRGLLMQLCDLNSLEDFTLGDFRRARAALKETGQ
jgi:hypothetical protein